MPDANLPGGVLVHLSPRGLLERPELVVAPGPAEIATTGAGTLADLYGYAWALVWDNNTPNLRLFRLDGGAWAERDPASPLPQLTSPARHIALAFDRSARPMIAWQALEGIYIRQWDALGSSYIVRGPFAGQDPSLVFDGLPAQKIGGADVVLYYLSDDRGQVHARLERDLYGVEYDVATLGRSDLYLDQVVRLPYRVRLELAGDQADAAGNLDRVRLVSDLSTLQASDTGALAGAPAGGVIDATTEIRTPDAEGATVGGSGAGTLDATTEVRTVGEGATLAGAGAGDLVATIEHRAPDPEGATVGTSGAGELEATTYLYDPDPDAAAVSTAASGELRAQP